jgi:branched-chain amino acid transport system ATP-binding protein
MRRVLKIQNLLAGYDGVPAVRNLTLSVNKGEVVALLGPNGAGKTTTLLAVSGLVKVFAGDIEVVGRTVPRLRQAHRLARWGVGHVPENRGVLFGLTVRENLLLAKRRGRVDLSPALEFFPQLEPLLERRAGLCSGGEQQMIALGRALLAQPQLLMIDEMSLGLAPRIFEDLLQVVRRLVNDGAVGVLMVEQYVEAALEVADRAFVLNHGELVLQGDAQQLLKNRALVDSAYMGEIASERGPVLERGDAMS